MAKTKLTKDEVLQTIKDEERRTPRIDVMSDDAYYDKVKSAAEDRADERMVEVLQLEDFIKKYSDQIGMTKARKLLAGLESYSYCLKSESKIVSEKFKAGKNLDLDSKGYVSKSEKKCLKAHSKNIDIIIKNARAKEKRLANQREDGKKLGKELNDLETIARNMVSQLRRGNDIKKVVEDAAGVKLISSYSF